MARKKQARSEIAARIAKSLPDFDSNGAQEVHDIYVSLAAEDAWTDFAEAAMDMLDKRTRKLLRTDKLQFLLAVAAYAGHRAGTGA